METFVLDLLNLFLLILFIFEGKSLLAYTNLFSAKEKNEKNDKIILKYFQ